MLDRVIEISEAPQRPEISSRLQHSRGYNDLQHRLRPGDGVHCTVSGSFALVVSPHAGRNGASYALWSNIHLNDRCRAMIGVVAGAGRTGEALLESRPKVGSTKIPGPEMASVKGQAMIAASHLTAEADTSMRETHNCRTRYTSRKKGRQHPARQTGRAKRRSAR